MIKVKDVQHHRNGVAGTGFWVVLFGKDGRNYVATAFDGEERCIATLDVDLLFQNNIKFGENSWRYEEFADDVLNAIKEAQKAH